MRPWTGSMRVQKGMKTLAKWQAYIEEYTKRLNEQARKQQDKKEGVTISTLHAVKGLEYDIVYILNVNEGSIPYRKAVFGRSSGRRTKIVLCRDDQGEKRSWCLPM